MITKKLTFKKILILSIFLANIAILFPFDFTQADACPTSTTVEERQAVLVGEVTDDGGDPNLEVWLQYGRTTSYGSETQHSSRYGIGPFCSTIYNLEPATTYNYRAVARNTAGTSYGENKTFTTRSSPAPTVDLKANSSDGPISVSYRSNVNLSWTSLNAASCNASGDWSGTKSISGSQSIQMNLIGARTFTLACTDSTGTNTRTDQVTINVTPNLPIVITKPAIVTY